MKHTFYLISWKFNPKWFVNNLTILIKPLVLLGFNDFNFVCNMREDKERYYSRKANNL